MLVWLDTHGATKRRRPSWIEATAEWSSMESTEGFLWTPKIYAPLLDYRRDAEWINVGDGWLCAQYDTFHPRAYVRGLKGCLWMPLEDVDGTKWQVPALLRPDGNPAIGMKNKLVSKDGQTDWVRFAPTEGLTRALECAQAMRPHCQDEFENLEDPDQLLDAMIAIIECAYNLNHGTIGCMGLIGDVLLYQGCKFSCAAGDLE